MATGTQAASSAFPTVTQDASTRVVFSTVSLSSDAFNRSRASCPSNIAGNERFAPRPTSQDLSRLAIAEVRGPSGHHCSSFNSRNQADSTRIVHSSAWQRVLLRDRRGLPDGPLQPDWPEHRGTVLSICLGSRHGCLRYGGRRRHARADRKECAASVRARSCALCGHYERPREDGELLTSTAVTAI